MAKADSDLLNRDLVSRPPFLLSRDSRQGWPYSVPAPELSISSSTPMQGGAYLEPRTRCTTCHPNLCFMLCRDKTLKTCDTLPSPTYRQSTHHVQRLPSVLHTYSAGWGTGRARPNSSCVCVVSGPPCRGIINHTTTKKGKKGNKPNSTRRDSPVIG